MKLLPHQISFMHLILRSPELEDGWRKVSSTLWPMATTTLQAELIELRPAESGGFIRLTERGSIVAEYLV